MANPQTPAPSTTTNPPSTETTRGADMLAISRGGVSVERHVEQLAAQAQLDTIMRDLEVSNAKVRDLEAIASKAAIVEQAQRHEIALVERKHDLTMEGQRQQWELSDAREERNRQLIEADRARNAVAEAQRVAEVRRQCDAINQQNNELHAAITREENRITTASVAYGTALGAVSGGAGALWSRHRGKGAKHGPGMGFVGIGGALTAAVPILAQYFKPTAPQLPKPVNAAAWDNYLLALTADNAGLRGQLAALQATKFSWSVVTAAAAGVGAFTYAVAS